MEIVHLDTIQSDSNPLPHRHGGITLTYLLTGEENTPDKESSNEAIRTVSSIDGFHFNLLCRSRPGTGSAAAGDDHIGPGLGFAALPAASF